MAVYRELEAKEEMECYIRPIMTHEGLCYHGLFHGDGTGVMIFSDLAEALITAENNKIIVKNVH